MRLPRRTARLRLTILYGILFLLCSMVFLGVTYLLVAHATMSAWAAERFANGVVLPGSRLLLSPSQAQATLGSAARQQNAADLRQLLFQSMIALGIVTVAAFALGWVMAGRVLRPVATITAKARQISVSNLHERLALEGPDDELKELGETLDGLLARLDASFEAQRHFIANASHELRTPLTADRTLLQVALDDPATSASMWRAAAGDLLASNTEQARLIDALLTLASSDGGLGQRERVDLAAIVCAALAVPRPGIDEMGLHVAAAAKPAILDGDRMLIERLVANLLDNAVHHNIIGGRIEIVTDTAQDQAVLSVINTGPVIPDGEVDRLFQPFQQLNRRHSRHRDGHGLGLSIVRAIATAHDATISVHARPGGGLSVIVTFPPLLRMDPGAAR